MMRGNAGILLAALAVGCTETIPTQPDLGFAAAASTSVVKVTNNNDAGPGSFRAGVETANLTGTVHTIQFRSGVGPVLLQSTVTYTGTQHLRIEGSGAVLDGADAGGNAFASTGGGDLELRRITVQNAPAVGVYVEVPFNATGVVRVALHEVTLQDNFLYGLHVDDRLGGEGNGADSPAGIVLDVQGSAVLRNNSPQAGKDYDGIRVDEGGDGDIDARVQHSTFSGNLADGLELDEAGSGDARLFVRQSHFDFN